MNDHIELETHLTHYVNRVLGRVGDPADFSFGRVHATTLFDAFGHGARGLGADRPSEIGHLLQIGPHPVAVRSGHASPNQGRAEERPVRPDRRVYRERIYREVALGRGTEAGLCAGRDLASALRYPQDLVDAAPPSSVARFVGLANPWVFGMPASGARVIDVGCGAGLDAILAAVVVGPSGLVVGVDPSPEMLQSTKLSAGQAGLTNLQLLRAYGERLPVPSRSFDLAVANGVILICESKTRAIAEMVRVVKPGGRVTIADMAFGRPLPITEVTDLDRWNSHRYRRPLVAEWIEILEEAGLDDLSISQAANPFLPDLDHAEAWTYTFTGHVR